MINKKRFIKYGEKMSKRKLTNGHQIFWLFWFLFIGLGIVSYINFEMRFAYKEVVMILFIFGFYIGSFYAMWKIYNLDEKIES